MMEHITYLVVDPGEKNGIAAYDEMARLRHLEVVHHKKLREYLRQFTNVKTVLVEEYRVYEHKAKGHTGSKLITAQMIGRVKDWAEDRDIKVIEVPAANYVQGFRFLGQRVPPRSDPLSHAKVAHAHFTFWAVKNKIIDPKEFL